MHMASRDPQDEDFRIQMISATETPHQGNDSLDDVFGSDPGSPAFESEDHEVRESHPSDVRRLQTEHATAGYREGITAAKAKSIQAGFDEGFSLGGTIGLKAGQVLGFLEGITSALRAENGDEYRQAQQLLEDARKELSIDMIYDQEYWAPDGTWKFEIQSATQESDIIFEDVASAHPLISKWDSIIMEQLRRWGIDLHVLEQTEDTSTVAVLEKKELKVDQQPREKLDW
ncbi:essential protein Yae1 [Truncatella angustata]|uniref:Protein YAE1 n=1 Tax=Truncatella angustata TaxID=152316 RepID=A0A9P8RJ84_9PEZI|nr:essential protein Yae1 [Truncatella angustata]KAH6647049.1 essential protein Yae1 [Truncatella angustata]KAH8197255.1 hypothetical protein TruAng_008577 [Truncatella angustata]